MKSQIFYNAGWQICIIRVFTCVYLFHKKVPNRYQVVPNRYQTLFNLHIEFENGYYMIVEINNWSELDAILQKHAYTYINDHGVMFSRVAPGFMFVDSPWPGFYIDEISLVFLCNNASEFFDRLEIENASQIDQVKPEVFFRLFHAGEVIVVCSTADEETLEFQISEGNLIANKEDSDLIHIVEQDLVTPEDFVEYTKQHFQNLKTEPVRSN